MKKTVPLSEARSGERDAGCEPHRLWQTGNPRLLRGVQSDDASAVELHADSLQDKTHHFELPHSTLIRLVTSLSHYKEWV